MKAFIRKKGNTTGRYYQGITINDIVRRFMQSNLNLSLLKLKEDRSRYELYTFNVKTNKLVIYEIPKYKIVD